MNTNDQGLCVWDYNVLRGDAVWGTEKGILMKTIKIHPQKDPSTSALYKGALHFQTVIKLHLRICGKEIAENAFISFRQTIMVRIF